MSTAAAAELARVLGTPPFEATVAHAADLSAAQRSQIWALFERNMKSFYQTASVGWHPTQKRKELYHRESRFLLVGNDTLAAFSMFRFEYEDDIDLIYCYELQVAPEAQRQGLGRKIIDALVRIGKAYDMEKIVLTVFLANVDAIAFYRKIGFETDDTSPLYDEPDGVEGVDYDIMSLEL